MNSVDMKCYLSVFWVGKFGTKLQILKFLCILMNIKGHIGDMFLSSAFYSQGRHLGGWSPSSGCSIWPKKKGLIQKHFVRFTQNFVGFLPLREDVDAQLLPWEIYECDPVMNPYLDCGRAGTGSRVPFWFFVKPLLGTKVIGKSYSFFRTFLN